MTCSQMLSIKTIVLINFEINLNTDSVWKRMNTIIFKPSLKSVTRYTHYMTRYKTRYKKFCRYCMHILIENDMLHTLHQIYYERVCSISLHIFDVTCVTCHFPIEFPY